MAIEPKMIIGRRPNGLTTQKEIAVHSVAQQQM